MVGLAHLANALISGDCPRNFMHVLFLFLGIGRKFGR
jgi:hypothetical protein